jgi:PAS domain S-box-containing protein
MIDGVPFESSMISVLLVDDDPVHLDLGKLFLERSGWFHVETANSAIEALAMIGRTTFDAIVADYQMSRMDGIELLKRVRATNPTVPFIIFTGKGREEVAIEAFDHGADFYLQKGGAVKPQFVELEHKIRQAVQKKRTEMALVESEERYRTILDSAQIGILLIDSGSHRIIEANPKALEIIGATREIVIGTVCHRFICPAENGRCPVTDLGHQYDSSERVLISASGEQIPILKTVVPAAVGGESVLVESFVDISGRKRIEEALTQVNKKLNLLSSVTRHDVRNKLQVLMGCNEMLRDQTKDPAALEYIRMQSDAMTAILRQIEFTKEYEDLGTTAPQWQHLHRIVMKAVWQLHPRDVSMKDETNGWWVYADPLLERVFYNLFENAIRYGGNITSIHLYPEPAGDSLTLICEDDGVGIPDSEKGRIFERGYGKNTGFGLFLIREILAITGMTIQETGVPGSGARFEIHIPKGVFRSVEPGEKGENGERVAGL